MPGPEEWPSRRSDPADRIRLTGPATTNYLYFKCLLIRPARLWRRCDGKRRSG